MSYTPPEQLLEEPFMALIDACEKSKKAMWERLSHPTEWKPEHLEELRALTRKINDIEVDVLKIAKENR